METNVVSQERKDVNEKIRKQVFRLEKENYHKKTLTSSEMISKIKKIVEGEVK